MEEKGIQGDFLGFGLSTIYSNLREKMMTLFFVLNFMSLTQLRDGRGALVVRETCRYRCRSRQLEFG